VFARGALYQRDVHLYWHAQAEAFVRAALAGSWPVWDRTLGFGQPLLANSSAQVLYPITWLNVLMKPWWYYTVFVAAHLVFSGAGLYVAGRQLRCRRAAAVVGAMLWTASGPFISLTILWHHFAGAAWLPWVVVASQALVASPDARRTVLLAAVLGAQQLAGSFEMSTMGALVAIAVVGAALGWPRPIAAAADRRIVGRACAALVLAIGISAGQWMATAEVAAQSGRRFLPRDVRTYWSVHPLSVPDLVLPGFSEKIPVGAEVRKQIFEGREPFMASLYLGLPSAGLVLAAFLDRQRRRTWGVLAAAAAIALLVALGRHGPAYDLLVTMAPPLKAFRYPVKVMVLVAMPWCLLASIGVDAWLRDPAEDPRRARIIRSGAVAVAALAIIAAAVLFGSGASAAARNAALAAGLSAVTAVAAAWRFRARPTPWIPTVVAATVALADLVFYHRSLNAVAPTELYTHRPEVIRFVGASVARVYAYDYSVAPSQGTTGAAERTLARKPDGWEMGPARALAEQMALMPVAASRWGLLGSYEVDYTGLFPVHVNQAAYLLRAVEGTPAHLRMLQLGSVDHVVALHEAPFADLRATAIIPGLFASPIRVFAVPDPMPRTYVASVTRTGEGIAGISTLLDPRFDFRAEVLVPAGAGTLRNAAGGTSRVLSASPDRMRLEVDAPEGGYVMVLESYDPGWRATVDGHPAAIVPANVLFRGIRVEPGAHVIDLVYRPPGLMAGLVLSATSILFAVGVAWRTRTRTTPDHEAVA
jgi:hypothetical protein